MLAQIGDQPVRASSTFATQRPGFSILRLGRSCPPCQQLVRHRLQELNVESRGVKVVETSAKA